MGTKCRFRYERWYGTLTNDLFLKNEHVLTINVKRTLISLVTQGHLKWWEVNLNNKIVFFFFLEFHGLDLSRLTLWGLLLPVFLLQKVRTE
jgi:hypothetical protein